MIDQRLAICEACPQYDAERHRCQLCGCCSGPSQKKWLNKVALATEECPDRPPRWGRYEVGLQELAEKERFQGPEHRYRWQNQTTE